MTPAEYRARRHRLARYAWREGYFAGLNAAARLGQTDAAERIGESRTHEPFGAWAAGEGMAWETPPSEYRWRGDAHRVLGWCAEERRGWLSGEAEFPRPTRRGWMRRIRDVRQSMADANDEGKDIP